MQPEQSKSIGGALVDVFDAAVSLVKTEIRLLSRRIGKIIRAKGIGVVLLLAAAAPLSLALIFLILTIFYALNLFLPDWASALIIAILALIVTGVLAMMGVRRLTAEVKDDEDAGDLAREDVTRAEKKLDQAEKTLQRDEKRVDKAEDNLAQAEERAQQEHLAGRPTEGVREPLARPDEIIVTPRPERPEEEERR